jgi:hypothetical protein
VLTDIANIIAFDAADAGGSSEWKMHANWSLWMSTTTSSAAVTR